MNFIVFLHNKITVTSLFYDENNITRYFSY